MDLWQIIVICVAALVVVGAVVWTMRSRQRSKHLREHFGPEYDLAVNEIGNPRLAESELAQRERRISKLNIRDLTMAERQDFASQWKMCQSQFVDSPGIAVQEAERMVRKIMETRGYPAGVTEDVEIANVSAAYPLHAADYREARRIATEYGQGHSTTENLRKAFVHYRALFDELLGGDIEELKRAS
jgi:hypothetical protein